MAAVSNSITLKHPITTTFRSSAGEREETVTEVTVRRPKAKDLRVVDAATGEVAQAIALMAQLTTLTVAQIDDLDVEDFAALGKVIEGFMPPGLLTGKTSSGS